MQQSLLDCAFCPKLEKTKKMHIQINGHIIIFSESEAILFRILEKYLKNHLKFISVAELTEELAKSQRSYTQKNLSDQMKKIWFKIFVHLELENLELVTVTRGGRTQGYILLELETEKRR